MLYVIILYCTGFCPAEVMGQPDDVLFFSSYADCQAELKSQPAIQFPGAPIDTVMKQICARMFADPKQLDRILNPAKLTKALADYKANGDGYKPYILPECEGKTICLQKYKDGPCGKGMGFGCLFKKAEKPADCGSSRHSLNDAPQDNRCMGILDSNPMEITTTIPCTNSNGDPSVIVNQSLPSKPTYP